MVKMSVINDALKNIVNAEKAGKRQVCDVFLQPLSLPVEEVLWPLDYFYPEIGQNTHSTT